MSEPSVLIVDDEPVYCDIMQEVLGSFGMQSRVASNIGQALSLLEEQDVDLILLDMMMPSAEGGAFLRWIRSHTYGKTLPILIVSAKAADRERCRAYEAGADGFLAKPFTPQQLREALIPLLQRSLI